MTIKQKLEKLAAEKNTPCVTISLNTHRTHPENTQDAVQLKNLLKEAEERVINEFGKRSSEQLLMHLAEIDIDVNYNLDSLHIFVSNDSMEIVKSDWPSAQTGVHISNAFNISPLIKSINRSEDYYILLLSQSGVHLYKAMNEEIESEIKNGDFPFSENKHYNTHSDKGSDSKHLDDLVREFLNKVDKAVVKMNNETGFNCVVISTEDNYSRLMQVADKPSVYIGYSNIDYNHTAQHILAKQSWELVKSLQYKRRVEAIEDIKEAVAQGKVLTDLQEIYQASIDGLGDLLIIHEDFSQPVTMTGNRTFTLAEVRTQADVIDDITSVIAWEVWSKKGRVIYTNQDEIKTLGNIALKTRY